MKKQLKPKIQTRFLDASSISEHVLQRLMMVWHVLFNWYFKKHSIPSNNSHKEIMYVIQRFGRWHICIVKHSDCKTWLHFGRMEGSITKSKHCLRFNGHFWALMGYLWLTRLQFWHMEYQIFFQADTCMIIQSGYRPKCDLHSVFFPFDYYIIWVNPLYSKIPTNYMMQMILYFWIKFAEI